MFNFILIIFFAAFVAAFLFAVYGATVYKDKKNRAMVNPKPELVPVTAEMLGVPGDLLNFVALSQGGNFTVNQAFKAMRQVGKVFSKKNVAVMLRKLARQKVIRRAGSAFQLRPSLLRLG
ncbi:MAG: hypothetical protein AAB465_02900 [Patescibacteria group bacterium]